MNLIFSKFDRAKQSRRAMIKHQIETMLNIKGKDMPSVEEEFGSAGNIYILYKHINPIQTSFYQSILQRSLSYFRSLLQQFRARKH